VIQRGKELYLPMMIWSLLEQTYIKVNYGTESYHEQLGHVGGF
jgi:hypothetical protein